MEQNNEDDYFRMTASDEEREDLILQTFSPGDESVETSTPLNPPLTGQLLEELGLSSGVSPSFWARGSNKNHVCSLEEEQDRLSQLEEEEEKNVLLGVWKSCVCCCPIFIGVAIAVYLLAFVAFVPKFGQTILDQATMNVVSMYMKNATNATITLNATVELHDIGEISATVFESQVDVIHSGIVIASVTLPELDTVGGEPLHFNMESELVVKNISAFTEATADILKGKGGYWYFQGKVDVSTYAMGFDRRFTVDLYKELLIPATLLEDVRGFDVEVMEGSGKEDSFSISAKTSFFSSSILEMHHLGLLEFYLEVPVFENGDLLANGGRDNNTIKVARVTIPDFNLVQGTNEYPLSGLVVKNVENEHTLSQFLSNFLNGIDQPAVLRGPVNAESPFLNEVLRQDITFEGLKDNKPIDMSFLSKDTFNGYNVKVPGVGRFHHRGAEVIAHNPLGVKIAMANITSEVMLAEPLGYDLENRMFGSWTCNVSSDLAKLYTAPGMWINEPTKEPIVEMGPHERVTFFLPGGPLDHQIQQPPCKVLGVPVAGKFDCCMVSVQIAAACRAKQSGNRFFNVNIETSFILHLGEFRLPLHFSQTQTSTLYEDALTKGFAMDGYMKCSDFDFVK
uniref:Uncharacterized protein n=1 Tax=Mucochytrium quahogii TaxID=96639 RepID=A0A7S2SMV3_9STRA|mmetsp:Transcript_9752/g.18230  ORF Transcript_9752/g.18230 Transcript_9752/m.18230 type:complete len:623 (+) Transcript_9752:1903-3771(+)